VRRIVIALAACLTVSAALGQGYLVERSPAQAKARLAVPIKAFAFPAGDVHLSGNSPFLNAMQRDAAYLLTVEPRRLLHRFYLNAALPVQGEVYGGWESDGLSGHTLGHYLSACALMTGNGDPRFEERVTLIVDELARCQEARGTGYVGAIPNEDSIFWKLQHGIIRSSGFDLNGGWSPWYTVHKVMAGLTDAYVFAHNQKALAVAEGMAAWTGTILKNLSEDQLEAMRKCEYGGMNDVLVHLYELTGRQYYLDLSLKFHDRFVLGQLEQGIDPLPGKHSNTNVPKAIGCARRYTYSGRASDQRIATFFWETMTRHHSYVIGGNSNYEYCGPEDQLNDRLSDATCETCNTYNMLKLTRHLFSWQPSSVYMDYYERALYNHILSSQNPETGMMCYFVPLRMGTRKEFSDPFNTFTCCVGSGMENHVKYTEQIYSEGDDGSLYINLFIPSELTWRSTNRTVKLETTFPHQEQVTLTVRAARNESFRIRVRRPAWIKGAVEFQVNGKPVRSELLPNGYMKVARTWRDNDRLSFSLPAEVHAESMPDNPNRIALLYGPVVLAGQLGKVMPDPVYGTTVLMTDRREPARWVTRDPGSLRFTTQSVARPTDVVLAPFYDTYDQYYNVYWDYFTEKDWKDRQQAYENEKLRVSKIEERTLDHFRIGEMQPERDHHLQASEKSYVSDALGRMGREARSGGFFSFDMKVDPTADMTLLLSYIGDDANRVFDIVVEGQLLATQELKGATTGRFFDISYAIPKALTTGKTKVEVRILANREKTAGRVFGCRTLLPTR